MTGKNSCGILRQPMEAAPSLPSGRSKPPILNIYYRTALPPSETAAGKCVAILVEPAPSLVVVVENESGISNSDVTSPTSHLFANNNTYAENLVSFVFFILIAYISLNKKRYKLFWIRTLCCITYCAIGNSYVEITTTLYSLISLISMQIANQKFYAHFSLLIVHYNFCCA